MGALSDFSDCLLIASSAANAAIGFLVLDRNRHARVNIYFACLCASIAGWSLTNALFQVVPLDAKLPFALCSYAFAGLLTVWFFLFCKELDGRADVRLSHVLVGAGILAAVGGLVPQVLATGVVAPATIRTHLIALAVYGIILVLLMGTGLRLLLHRLRVSIDLERARAQFVLAGLSLGAAIGVVCNLLLPLLGTYAFVAIGPVGGLFFAALTAYAMVRHRLFDLHLVIARSLGYLLALAVLGVVYALFVFRIGDVAFHLHFSTAAQAYLILIGTVTGIGFGRLRQAFDRVTTRLFHRDAYDVQDLYDELNQVLLAKLEVSGLLQETSDLLKRTFKADFVVIGLKESEDRPRQIAGALPGQNFDRPVRELRKLTVHYPHVVLAADYLESHASRIREILQENGVAVLLRLAPDVTSQEEGLGYVAFGRKASGNPYTGQDLRVLDAVGKELIMAVQNALHFQETQTFNDELQTRISAATAKLQHSNSQLRELVETKDDFVSMVSHQLRTPLTSIKGFISEVLDGDGGPLTSEQRTMLETAFSSSQQMVGLISDLLNLTRLRTGKFVIQPSAVDLPALVQAEVDLLSALAKARGVRLVYHRPTGFPELMLDGSKMEQVVMNFIDNAVRYTPAGGTVTVKLDQTAQIVECTVTDTGIGVPEKVQHRLFTRFYRAGNARAMRPDGTGIGLFMAKKVIVAQGGAIIFQSEEGKGSTFGFRVSKSGKLTHKS